MRRIKKKTTYTLFAIVIALMLVVGAVYRCSVKVGENLETEMESTLQDIAGQNVLVLNKEIRGKYRLLMGLAANLQDDPAHAEDILQGMKSFVSTYDFKRMGYVHADGKGRTTDGYEINLADRTYFQKSMEGKVWLSAALEDDIDATMEYTNVFSVPVYDSGGQAVEGVIFATYRSENFQDVMNVDFFDARGYSCIIQKDGSVIAHSLNSPIQGQANFFEGLTDSSAAALQEMQSVMNAGGTGFGKCRQGAENSLTLFYYMPLNEDTYGAQWYMVALVPGQVLTERTDPIMSQVDRLTAILLVIALLSLLFYIHVNRRQKKDLMELAYVDRLTGGYNFARFRANAKEQRHRSGYVIALDLSGFKIINSVRGVQKGDETLLELWKILQENRQEHEMVARVNADRFVLFFTAENRERLERRLDGLIDEIEGLTDKLNIPKVFPVFGIYYTESLDEPDKAYGCAVQAKHLVKGRRDRHYAFYEEIDDQNAIENRKLEDCFEGALEAGQFEAWFQPKYSVQGGEAIGAEALVRWRRPDGRLLSPGIFIPLFEKNGYITVLDEYIFRSVCEQQKKWLEEGRKVVPVSVNISRFSLYFNNIVKKYADILKTLELDPKYVQLEIIESATVDNEDIASLIEGFHKEGFSMLLDDFGSGYSSLSSLNTMHFDTLKLDKSLIDYIGDGNGEKLLKSITKLGQSLGLHITAEGVETEAQLEFLQDLQCDDIQGYYFSKPLPKDEYEKIL